MFELKGKKALITGASGGIGGEIARTLHKAGADIAISGTRLESLNSLAEEIGSNIQIFQCNLNDPVAIDDLLKTCLLYTSPSPRDVEESRMPSSA